jgi:hypothetical protein
MIILLQIIYRLTKDCSKIVEKVKLFTIIKKKLIKWNKILNLRINKLSK